VDRLAPTDAVHVQPLELLEGLLGAWIFRKGDDA
jgi:hypothetical protein